MTRLHRDHQRPTIEVQNHNFMSVAATTNPPSRMDNPKNLLSLLLLALSCLTGFGQSAEVHSFTNLVRAIPDGNASGLSDNHSIVSSISSLGHIQVKLQITGEFNGDLYGYLRHIQGGETNFCVLINRVGRSATNSAGYADAGFDIVLDDGVGNGDIHLYQETTIPGLGEPISGTWQPDGRIADPGTVTDASPRETSLASFIGASGSGEWTLFLADLDRGGTNLLQGWELTLDGKTSPGVTWSTPSPITYGNALGVNQLNATSSVPGTLIYTPPAGTILNAGTGQVLSVTFHPDDTNAYVVVTSTVSIDVLKQDLTIAVSDTNKVYGNSDPSFGVNYSGFVNGEGVAALSGTLTITRAPGENVGTYAISAGGLSSSNYHVLFADGNLAITPATLTVSAGAQIKIYGGADPVLTYSVSGLKFGDLADEVLSGSLARSAGENVAGSPYAIGQGTLVAKNNYTLQFTGSSLTINKAGLTVKADDRSRLYGHTNPVLTVSYSGFVNGENPLVLEEEPQAATLANTNSPTGLYSITVSGGIDDNYAFLFQDGVLAVTDTELVVKVADATKIYGQTNPTFGVTYSGFVNGEDATVLGGTLVLSSTAATNSGVGNYPITAGGLTSTNYAIRYENGNLTISPASLAVSVSSTNKVYGSADPTFAASYSGFVNGQNASVLGGSLVINRAPGENVGIYSVSAGGLVSSNYAISYIDGSLTISRASSAGLVTSSSNPTLPGAGVTFTYSLSAVPPGGGTPTGLVQFKIDGVNAGSPAPLNNGAAVYAISSLSVGVHSIEAEYAGSANFFGTTNSMSAAQLVNTPPVAGPDTMERFPNGGAKVRIATLLSNDSDADGDAVTFVGFSATSAQGGSLSQSNGWIIYSPAAGNTNVDSFTYTISDGRGAPVTGTVTVNVIADTTPSPNLTITNLGNGSYLIRFDGIPGRTYRIEYSDSLEDPHWQTLGNGTADDVGRFQFIDAPPGTAPTRYYRSAYP